MATDQKYKIFIVDDDTFLLNMYTLKFGKDEFEVNSSQNGNDALAKIEGGYTPDIILLDIIMPGMDGIEMLTKVREKKLVPNATVIMLTNQSDTPDIEKSKNLGVQGYIVKATTIPSEIIKEVKSIHLASKK